MQWAASGKAKWAKRLNVLFADESKAGFRFRLRQARRRRDEVRRTACLVPAHPGRERAAGRRAHAWPGLDRAATVPCSLESC